MSAVSFIADIRAQGNQIINYRVNQDETWMVVVGISQQQARVVGHLERTRADHPDRAVVLVSHADVIKAALLYCLGMPIDSYRLFDISPASVSTLVLGDWGAKVLAMNEVP